MQHNVTDLSHKLQRSLDNNYNVVDMPAVMEIISSLEKTAVTKELLETTRLGKYINELRRKTSNELLAKRAKDLVKKWRVLLLPDANGQLKPAVAADRDSPDALKRKRAARDRPEPVVKRANGQARELDFSDSSNCSLKDSKKTDVIFINSDSNSSAPEAPAEEPLPKRRGRKKGSRNHRNLVAAAEESFSNKMAVSRNAKVKTTQELLADLQNRRPDIERKAARLTESLSRIDQKLNPQKKLGQRPAAVAVAAAPRRPDRDVKQPRLPDKKPPDDDEEDDDVVIVRSDDEIDVVGDTVEAVAQEPPPEPITIESILAQLPPVDREALADTEPVCGCPVPVDVPDEPADPSADSVCVADDASVQAEQESCEARLQLCAQYGLGGEVTAAHVRRLHGHYLPNVNGNRASVRTEHVPSLDIVPDLGGERLAKDLSLENFNKYSVSIGSHAQPDAHFREWHETLDVESYDGDTLKILPYVIID